MRTTSASGAVMRTDATDEPSRAAIRTELDTTMLVEAGAGSGKTTLMVERLLAYIARGTPVDQLAAVTFTRKAANELRQRLEAQIERRVLHEEGETRDRFATALRDRERMFIGTVHAFCGRILREYSLEAGLPPDFKELDEAESTILRAAAWRQFIERAATDNSELLRRAYDVGIDPLNLYAAFAQREQYRDVSFDAPESPAPTHELVRDALHALMQQAGELRRQYVGTDRDKLQRSLDRLSRSYQVHEQWTRPTEFAADVQLLLSSTSVEVVQKQWGETKEAKNAAKNLSATFRDFVEQELKPWYAKWWAHVYAPVMELLQQGSNWALQQRRHSGQLGFDDLLTETAALLRTNASARQSIGERWCFLLVDEFQDTDPVQAEVCFLIASDPSEGNDWRTVTLRPGSLFVVGDPKQSIYRFRRADLAMYQTVQQRIAQCGTVQRLTRNFRSVPAIGALVNEHFVNVFVSGTPQSNAPQAAFAEFVAASTRPAHPAAGIARYQIGRAGKESNEQLTAEDAAVLASWIAKRCAPGGDRHPQDFLILTPRKPELAAYAHELAVRNIPVSVTGAPNSVDDVLQELLVLIRALADPANPIAVIAALEGWCVGCSHADLWEARQNRHEFRLTHTPHEATSNAGFGLLQLHRWWMASQQLPAATLLERVLDESGLLIVAASSELGDTSAGGLMQLVATLHANGGADLASAIEIMEQSLNADETAATLRPARADAVRLMNLHKAKGLEAPVVILAAPLAPKPREPGVATWREGGMAVGVLRVVDDEGNTLAQPLGWQARADEESMRSAAEWDRLLYVAVTRAEEELVVSQRATYALANGDLRGDTGRWAPLADVLSRHARELELSIDEPQGRNEVAASGAEVRADIANAALRLSQSKPPRYELISVTESVKRNAEQAEQDGAPLAMVVPGDIGSDMEFSDPHAASRSEAAADRRTLGSLVHAALEGALRGRTGAGLAAYVKALVWNALPLADDAARMQWQQDVLRAVDEARKTESWSLLSAAGTPALAELTVSNFVVRANTAVLTEGVIDAAAERDGQWIVVDWKLNRSSDATWQTLVETYERQAASYVDTLAIRTGISGSTRIERLTGT